MCKFRFEPLCQLGIEERAADEKPHIVDGVLWYVAGWAALWLFGGRLQFHTISNISAGREGLA